MPIIRKEDDKKRNILCGFSNESVVHYIEKNLEEDGYTIAKRNRDKETTFKSRVEYSKREIFRALKEDSSIDTVVVVESLEMREGFSMYELADMKKDRDLNIIVLLEADRKGSDFIRYLYAAGIYSAVFNPARTEDIVELIKNPRTREKAREMYGIEVGHLNRFVLCNSYINTIERYLLSETGMFTEKFEKVKSFLTKNEMSKLKRSVSTTLLEKIEECEGGKKVKISVPKVSIPKVSIPSVKLPDKNESKRRAQKIKEDDSERNQEDSPIVDFFASFCSKGFYVGAGAIGAFVLVWAFSNINQKNVEGQIGTVYQGEDVVYVTQEGGSFSEKESFNAGESTEAVLDETSTSGLFIEEVTTGEEATTELETTTQEETSKAEITTSKKATKKKKVKKKKSKPKKKTSKNTNTSSGSNSNYVAPKPSTPSYSTPSKKKSTNSSSKKASGKKKKKTTKPEVYEFIN